MENQLNTAYKPGEVKENPVKGQRKNYPGRHYPNDQNYTQHHQYSQHPPAAQYHNNNYPKHAHPKYQQEYVNGRGRANPYQLTQHMANMNIANPDETAQRQYVNNKQYGRGKPYNSYNPNKYRSPIKQYGDKSHNLNKSYDKERVKGGYKGGVTSETSSVNSLSPRSNSSSGDWASMVEEEMSKEIKPLQTHPIPPTHIRENTEHNGVTDTEKVAKSHRMGSSLTPILDASREDVYVVFIIIPLSHADGTEEERKSIGFECDAAVLSRALEYKNPRIKVYKIYADRNKTVDEILANKPQSADLCIFIQQINMFSLLDIAPQNWLLCNQEVFLHSAKEDQLKKIRRVNVVLCKTQAGVDWVKMCKEKYGFTYKIIYTCFTSPMHALSPAECPRKRDLILHTAGQHHWKQTGPVIDCWYDHPDLPTIVITCFQSVLDEMLKEGWVKKEAYEAAVANKIPNLILYREKLRYIDLVELKSKAGAHICCSFTEGWGHHINESRICGAVTITTNSAPMNELIHPDCGILIMPYKTEKKKNGTDIYFIRSEDLYLAMKVYLQLSDEARLVLGRNGHTRYLNDKYTYEKAMEKIKEYILSGFDDAHCPAHY